MASAAKSHRNSLVRQVPLPYQVANLIHARVSNGELHPGDRIVEQDLAREYGVARGVVREALVKLDGQGVVQRRPNKGTFVTKLSVGRFVKLMQIRAALELLGYELIVKRDDLLDFKEVEQMLRGLRDATKRRDIKAFAETDRWFHVALVRLSDNEYLVDEFQKYIAHTVIWNKVKLAVQEDGTPFLSKNHWDSWRMNDVQVSNHEKILLALKARALDEARLAFHKHLSPVNFLAVTGILGADPRPS